jgi:hypothetical protein
VALRAVRREHGLAAFHGHSVGLVRRWWRRQGAQEALDALHRRQFELARDGAVPEGRTDYHLSHRIVQAIPMQRCMRTNLLACIEIPNRLHVAIADGLVVGEV